MRNQRKTILNDYGETGGTVRYAIGKNKKRIGFLTTFFSQDGRRRTKSLEVPSPEFRRIIAQNLEGIEKKLGSRILRTSNGHILSPLGAGHWGVVFRLTNGNVLKVSKDPTEGGSALFWKETQSKKPETLMGTAKVYNVFSVRKPMKSAKSGRRYYYFIEREEIDPESYIPSPIRQYLNKFINEFHAFCSSSSANYSHLYLKRAKIALESLRKHAPGMAKALCYAWDKGLPLIDASEHNIGIRFRKGVGSKAKIGQWVIFDFGGLSQRCFDLVVKDSKGRKTNIKGILKLYCKKVPVLK
jgi:hypothetical protein